MVPFYLSISLIVNCPGEVHDQVASLLRGLRGVLEARDARTLRPDPMKQMPSGRMVDHMTLETSQSPPSEKPIRDHALQQTSRQRVQQLLEELQKEIARLPVETP